MIPEVKGKCSADDATKAHCISVKLVALKLQVNLIYSMEIIHT